MIYQPINLDPNENSDALMHAGFDISEKNISLRIGNLPTIKPELPAIIDFIANDLQRPDVEDSLLSELFAFLSNIQRSLQDFINLSITAVRSGTNYIYIAKPGLEKDSYEQVIGQFYTTQEHLTYLNLDNPDWFNDAIERAKRLKNDIENAVSRMYIIDRNRYALALYNISKKITARLLMGVKIAIVLPDNEDEYVRSPGYVSYLVYNLIFQQLKEIDRLDLLESLTLSHKVDPEATEAVVLDDFIVGGYRMRTSYYPHARRIYGQDFPIKVFTIAAVSENKDVDGDPHSNTSVECVYEFQDNDFFTSTTSDVDHNFSDSTELRDLIKRCDEFSGLVVCSISKEPPYDILEQDIISSPIDEEPIMLNAVKVQLIKPYKADNISRVYGRLKEFFKRFGYFNER